MKTILDLIEKDPNFVPSMPPTTGQKADKNNRRRRARRVNAEFKRLGLVNPNDPNV